MKVLSITLLCLSNIIGCAHAQSVDEDIDHLSRQLNIDRIESKLARHDASALAIIPASNGKTVANVFKKNHLAIANNSDVGCYSVALKPLNSPGCLISIYVTRKKSSGKYSDLTGVHAIWARGLKDKNFHPANAWAEHVTQADSWIQPGGMLDMSDRP